MLLLRINSISLSVCHLRWNTRIGNYTNYFSSVGFLFFFFLIRFFGWFRTLFHRKRKKIHKTLLQINSCSTIFFFSVHHLHSNRFHLVQLHNNSLCIKKMIGKWFCSKAAEVKPKEKTQTERKNRKTEKRKKKTQLQNIGIGLSLIKQKYYDAHVRWIS